MIGKALENWLRREFEGVIAAIVGINVNEQGCCKYDTYKEYCKDILDTR